MTPRGHAIAFRIWQFCRPLGWDCTLSEVAEELDLPIATVRAIIKLKNWGGRLRMTKTHYRGSGGNDYALSVDAVLCGSGQRAAVDEYVGVAQ